MRNSMLRMLGALMCVLAACADVVPVRDFDLEKVRGRKGVGITAATPE